MELIDGRIALSENPNRRALVSIQTLDVNQSIPRTRCENETKVPN